MSYSIYGKVGKNPKNTAGNYSEPCIYLLAMVRFNSTLKPNPGWFGIRTNPKFPNPTQAIRLHP